jgi:hypothetical protein
MNVTSKQGQISSRSLPSPSPLESPDDAKAAEVRKRNEIYKKNCKRFTEIESDEVSTKLALKVAEQKVSSIGSDIQRPLLDPIARACILPESMKIKSELVFGLFVMLCRTLEYTIFFYKDGDNAPVNLTPAQERMVLGMLSFVMNPNKDVRLNKSDKDEYETGLAIGYSLMVSSVFGKYNILKALRKSQRWFANNNSESEIVTSGKRKLINPVIPARELVTDWFYKEEVISVTLRNMLFDLIRDLYPIVEEDTKTRMVTKYSMPINDYLVTYHTFTIQVQGEKSIEKREKIPGKPSPSPVMLKCEHRLILNAHKSLFETEIPNQNGFISGLINERGTFLTKLDKFIAGEYKLRKDFLVKYSKYTTQRLASIKNTLKLDNSKRKAVIKPDELVDFFSSKPDPVMMLYNSLSRGFDTREMKDYLLNLEGILDIQNERSLTSLNNLRIALEDLMISDSTVLRIFEKSGYTPVSDKSKEANSIPVRKEDANDKVQRIAKLSLATTELFKSLEHHQPDVQKRISQKEFETKCLNVFPDWAIPYDSEHTEVILNAIKNILPRRINKGILSNIYQDFQDTLVRHGIFLAGLSSPEPVDEGSSTQRHN